MSGPRSARVVDLSDQERATLEALTRRTTVAAGLVRRARMVLLACSTAEVKKTMRRSISLDMVYFKKLSICDRRSRKSAAAWKKSSWLKRKA